MIIKKKTQDNYELIDSILEESIENSKFYNYIREKKFDKPLIKEIDKYKIPYCYQDAIDHRAASKIGIAIQNTTKICKCCSKPIEKNRKPFYKWEIKDMYFLGAGYPLYFNYLILIIVFYVIVTGLNTFSAFVNYRDNRCETNSNCKVTFSTLISYGNRNYTTNQYKGILLEMINLLQIIIFILFIEKIYFQKQANIKQDQTSASCPSNYTVKINNIKWDSHLQNPNLKEYIKQQIRKKYSKNKKVEINQVIVCFKTQRLRKYENRIQDLVQQKQQFMRQCKNQIKYTDFNFKKESKIKRVLKKLIKFKERLSDVPQIQKNLICQQKYFTGTAFVVFENQSGIFLSIKFTQVGGHCIKFNYFFIEKNEVLKMKELFLEQLEWYLVDAEQPNEIIWDNFSLNYKEHLKRKKYMNLVLIFILSVGLSIILAVYLEQDNLSEKLKGKLLQNQIVSLIMSLSTISVNILIQTALFYIIIYLSFQNKTMKAEYYVRYNCFFKLFNLTITQIIVFLIVNRNNSQLFLALLYSEFGLVNTQLTTFVLSILDPLKLFFLDFGYYYKLYKKNKESRKNESVKTQNDLQIIYEFPEFELEKFYSETILSILTTAFYLPISPIYSICLLIKICLYYCITKMIFIHRRIVKFNLGNELDDMVQIFLIISVGIFQLVWTISFFITHFDSQRWWEMLPTILGLISVIAYFFRKIFLSKKQTQEAIENKNNTLKTYTKERDQFQTEYARENPFTEFEEKNMYFKDVERKNRKQESILKRLNDIFIYKNKSNKFDDSQSIFKIKNQSQFSNGVNKLMNDIMKALAYNRDLLKVKETDGIDYISYVNKKNRHIQKKLIKWAKQQDLLISNKLNKI
ncbi:hypothetical protein ABPG73_012724 [Tetrahymena malaccensis]